jgi:hypothetical protein
MNDFEPEVGRSLQEQMHNMDTVRVMTPASPPILQPHTEAHSGEGHEGEMKSQLARIEHMLHELNQKVEHLMAQSR